MAIFIRKFSPRSNQVVEEEREVVYGPPSQSVHFFLYFEGEEMIYIYIF